MRGLGEEYARQMAFDSRDSSDITAKSGAQLLVVVGGVLVLGLLISSGAAAV
jgi:hypothetical protein